MEKDQEALIRIARNDVSQLAVKDASYGSSWRRRGGVGAFMMMARKFDRLEQTFKGSPDHSSFGTMFHDGDSVANDIRDMRRYALLITEARSAAGSSRTDWIVLREIAEKLAASTYEVLDGYAEPSAAAIWGVLLGAWVDMEAELRDNWQYDILAKRDWPRIDHNLAEVAKNLYLLDLLYLGQPPEHFRGQQAKGNIAEHDGCFSPPASVIHPQ